MQDKSPQDVVTEVETTVVEDYKYKYDEVNEKLEQAKKDLETYRYLYNDQKNKAEKLKSVLNALGNILDLIN